MNSRMTNFLYLIVTSFALSACGGGGGDSVSADSGSTSVVDPVSEVVAIQIEATPEEEILNMPVVPEEVAVSSTSDLIVGTGFLFKSHFEAQVQAAVESRFDALTICKLMANSTEPDYSRCLLRANLGEGTYSGNLLVTNDTKQLVISLWDFSFPESPQQSLWDFDVQGALIRLN